MKVSPKLALAAMAALGSLGGSAFAEAPATVPSSVQDVSEQLKALQAKVAELEKQQQASDKATIASVLDDAHNRSQLLQVSGPDYSVGYEKGFFIQSADKAFTLKPGLIFQARNTTNWREDAKDQGENSLQNGWEIRRLKVYATGNLYTPDLSYGVQIAIDSGNGNTAVLDDVYVQYKFATHNAVKIGQYKGPFNREEIISDSAQLAVERSVLNQALGGGITGPRAQGISFLGGFGGKDYNDDPVRYELMWHDGDRQPNTNWVDTNGTSNVGAIGRVEWKAFGKWSDYNKVSAKGNAEDLLVFGGAVAISDASGTVGSTVYRATVDALYQGLDGKLSLFGAVIGSHTKYRNVGEGVDNTQFDVGGLVQAGYVVAPNWEPFVRANIVVLDNPVGTVGDTSFPELTAGVIYYFGPDGKYGNRAKFTIDLSYLPSGVPSTTSPTYTGLGEQPSGGRDEIVLRAQFQFAL